MTKIPDDIIIDAEVDGRAFSVAYRLDFSEWTGQMQWFANVYEHHPGGTELLMHCGGVGDEPFTEEDAVDLIRQCQRVKRALNEKRQA